MKLIKSPSVRGGRQRITAVSLVVCAAWTSAPLLTTPARASANTDERIPARVMLTPTTSCESLAGLTVPSSAIELATSGATITSTTLRPATPEVVGPDEVTHALPEYCEVSGSIHPVDPAAPPINFQVNIPTRWNQMTVQVGGGGLNGSIPSSLASNVPPTGRAFPPDADYPMSDGYAMYGGDSGHQDPSTDATWALNDEAWQNFGYASLKKTHDVAFSVIRALYGKKPKVSYFVGNSQGGREALEVAQRYPKDYDGVVATAPLMGYSAHVIHKTLLATVQMGPGWISPAKYEVVADEVMRQCDALDGLDDGVIGNYLRCEAQFDPLKVAQPYDAIRCPDGGDAADDCVSDAQIATLNQMHRPTEFGYELANGWTEFPGYGVGREAFSGASLRRDSARIALNPAIPTSVIPASVPPAKTTSARPSRIMSAASPIAMFDAAQAVH
jgi:pimeloyl-ACP methyl ester carboxylesterase